MNRHTTPKVIVERLGNAPNDFFERVRNDELQAKSKRRLKAGVLFPLYYSEKGFVIHLIKRSELVSQAGDLSFPGGMLNPVLDRILMRLIQFRCLPIMTGDALHYARKRGNSAFSIIALFFANALRESWEEVRLNPLNVEFLGPLPSYDLFLFQRSIFPLVGLVKKNIRFRSNKEVEKMVAIPLENFFDARYYATCLLRKPDGSIFTRDNGRELPCFVHQDSDGQHEILWGATFQIIMSFLAIVFDHHMPPSYSQRIVEKKIKFSYLTNASSTEECTASAREHGS